MAGPTLATLGIKVENREVLQATTALNSMTVAGGKTEAATTRLTRRMALLEIEARNMDVAQRQLAVGVDYTARAMAMEQIRAQEMDAAMRKAAADSRALAEAQRQAATSVDYTTRAMGLEQASALKMDAALKQAGRSSFQLTGGMGGLAGALQAVAGAMAVRQLVAMADEYKNLHSRIALVTSGSAELARVESQLFAVSQQTRTEMDANVRLYTALARSTKSLGVDQSQLVGITKTVAQSLIVSGASVSETNSAVRQLSQAFASGVLRGDEFNSIAENAPRLQQAVAASLNVSIGALRQMAADGKLTGAVLATALLKQAKEIQAEFDRMPVTVSGAMVRIRNSMLMAVGAIDGAQGATAGMATTLSDLAGFIPKVASVVNSFFGGLQLAAMDAAIAVERLKAAFETSKWQTVKGLFSAATGNTSGMLSAGVAVAGGMGGDSRDTIALLEKRRALLVATLLNLEKVTTATKDNSAAAQAAAAELEKLTAAQLKALRELEAARERASRLALSNLKIDIGTEIAANLRKQEEAAKQLDVALAGVAAQFKRIRDAQIGRDADAADLAAKKKYVDDIRAIWQEGVGNIAADFVKSMSRGFESVYALAVSLMRRMEKEMKDSGAKYAALKYGAAAIGGGLAGYAAGQQAGSAGLGALSGAASGAMAGAAFGPWGALVGGIAGAASGLLGFGKAAREAAKQMVEAQNAIRLSITGAEADLRGDILGAGTARIKAEIDAMRKAVEDAFSGGGANSDQVRKRNIELARLDVLEAARIQRLRDEIDATKAATAAAEAAAEAQRLQAEATEKFIRRQEELRSTEDLSVRMLRAQGLGGRADDIAFQHGQQREYGAAVLAGRSPEFLALLTSVQVQEAIALAQLKANDAAVVAIQDAAAKEQARYDVEIKTAQEALAVNEAQLRAQEAAIAETQRVIDTLKEFSRGLLLNTSLTTLSPIQQLAEARRQFEGLLAQARSGDRTAAGNLPGSASAFLTASRGVNASSLGYVSDFQRVQQGIGGVTGGFQSQLSLEQRSYIELQSQGNALSAQLAALNAAKDQAAKDAQAQIDAVNNGTAVMADGLSQMVELESRVIERLDALTAEVRSGSEAAAVRTSR